MKSWADIITNPREVLPWLALLLCSPTLGLISVVVYGLAFGGATVVAVGFMVAGGAFTIGALLGFLFGVPRALSSPAQGSGLRSNTNLEQISDWLTKILVGVGLVEIGKLANSGSRLVRFLAPGLGDAPSSEAFAAGLLAFYWTSGFMIGYIATRAVVAPLFSGAERVLEHGDSEAEQESEPPPASTDIGRAEAAGSDLAADGDEPVPSDRPTP